MSEDEILDAAWDILLGGAESLAEDWIDEEGEFAKEDRKRIFDAQFKLLNYLRHEGRPPTSQELSS